MTNILARYRKVDYTLPETYLSWDLFGKGIEHLGKAGAPVEYPLRDPGDDEILLRVDALGLCFSDTKLIWAGNEHPRIQGRDLQADPTVPGHEAAMTIVKVGAKWADRFQVGQRFIIQADIFIQGEQMAFGYVQRGAMAQFAYVNGNVLDGDDGCYLLPMQEHTGYAEAALVEPWACVEAAYHIPSRDAPLPKGRLLIVFAGDARVDFTDLYCTTEPPALTTVLGEPTTALTPVLGPVGLLCKGNPTPGDIDRVVKEETGGKGYDDILLIGAVSAALVEACDRALAPHGILCFLGEGDFEPARIDIGRVHYHYTRHVGSDRGDILGAYAANTRQELMGGGVCWMIGAAGPMGQMHVQRALELENPPRKIFATDIAPERLQYMKNRLQHLADRKNIDLVIRDVTNPEGLDDELRAFTDGLGFDDVYVHAPVARLAEHAAHHLAKDAVFNIFAGVPLGTMATMSPAIFTRKQVRMIGSSGSSMEDILGVLGKCEAGTLATRMSLAALGGIETVHEGIQGVKDGRFPGKTVIFPQIRNLPLMEPAQLAEACPAAFAALEQGSIWTTEAEQALLEDKLRLE